MYVVWLCPCASSSRCLGWSVIVAFLSVVPDKSDSDVLLCLLFLSKTTQLVHPLGLA